MNLEKKQEYTINQIKDHTFRMSKSSHWGIT